MNATNKAAIVLIRSYQLLLSPVLGSQCRFTPTCSAYAVAAFKKYSFPKALLLSCKRILRCHPFSPGGYDPI